MTNTLRYILIWSAVGLALFVPLLIWAPGFAMFGETLLYWGAAIAAFATFDHYVMNDIDTIQELKSGNTSYALFLVAIAILFNGIATLVG